MVSLLKLLILLPPVIVLVVVQWFFDMDHLFSPWVLAPFGVWMLAAACLVRPKRKAEWALYVLAFASLFVVWRIPFTPRKAFILHFQRISVGDTLEQVGTKLEPYDCHIVADNGTDMEIQVYHEETDGDSHGRYNADIAVIRLHAGKVSSTDFLPD